MGCRSFHPESRQTGFASEAQRSDRQPRLKASTLPGSLKHPKEFCIMKCTLIQKAERFDPLRIARSSKIISILSAFLFQKVSKDLKTDLKGIIHTVRVIKNWSFKKFRLCLVCA
jgi:hypothetical protein